MEVPTKSPFIHKSSSGSKSIFLGANACGEIWSDRRTQVAKNRKNID